MNIACFIGHREINETEELKLKLYEIIKKLIVNKNVDTFLFGSKSRFNSLCLEIVSNLKEKHPHLKRVYVRAEYPIIDENYKDYLLKNYEDTYYSEKLINSGKIVYVKRNFEMIDKSDICVFYYNKENEPQNRKSGTKIALDYAKRKEKEIIIFK